MKDDSIIKKESSTKKKDKSRFKPIKNIINTILAPIRNIIRKKTENSKFFKKLSKQKQLVIIVFPFLIFIFIFNYWPLWGWIMAFQDFKAHLGVWESQWVGLKNFQDLFTFPDFYTALRNTFAISILKLVFGFVSTIALALFLNEVRISIFKRSIQTISYLPHFVSWVVAANIVFTVLSPDSGIVNEVLLKFGIVDKAINFLGEPNLFWLVAAFSHVWKEVGWGAIIYLSAIAGIDPEIYEAASIDGAGRLKKIFTITLPSIAPLIKILLILNLGWLLNAGFEQIYLLQKPATWDFSEILEIHIFKYGIQSGRWSYATAAGIFNSIVGLTLVLVTNRFSKKIDGERAF